MRHILVASVISVLVVAVGVLHGLATDRWSEPSGDADPGRPLASLPMEIGDWIGERLPRQEGEDSKTSVINMRYTNRSTGRWVITSLTTGRSGRVSVHNPEHCYLGSGYQLADTIREETIGQNARFWTGHFQKKRPSGTESIRIYWGWTGDGTWQAPNYPRLYYAGKSRLHKLYVIHNVTTGENDDTQSYTEFMVAYLSELNKYLGP